MFIRELVLEDVRILQAASISPHQHINLLRGPNGAGKTTILESLHILSQGRSFRHTTVRPLIRDGARLARVVGSWVDEQDVAHRGGVEKSLSGETRVRLDRTDCRALDTARALPVQLFSREHADLLGDGPSVRRKLLDWILFHVEPSFYVSWRRFHRALKQRNQLLRRGRMAAVELDAWDSEYAESALALHDLRIRHAERLFQNIEQAALLLDGAAVALGNQYSAGWDQRRELAELISSGRERDLQSGHSRVGPHRSDWLITWNGQDPERILSTGQRKLLAWGLRLDAVNYVSRQTGRKAVLLVDEMGADLDERHMGRLAGALTATDTQLFCASVSNSAEAHAWQQHGRGSMFHVEHGEVQQTGEF